MVQSPLEEHNFLPSQKFPVFVEPEDLLPLTKESASCPYPGPDQSNRRPPNRFLPDQ